MGKGLASSDFGYPPAFHRFGSGGGDDPFLGKLPGDMTIFELLGLEESLDALIKAGILEEGQTMEEFLDMPWMIETDYLTPES